MTNAFLAVRYDRRGSFTDVSFHDTLDEALAATREDEPGRGGGLLNGPNWSTPEILSDRLGREVGQR